LQRQREAGIRHEGEKKRDRIWDIVLTVAFAAGPFGFGVPIFYSCISWSVAWLAFVHLIWNLQVKLMPNIVQVQEEWQWDPGTPSGGLFLQGKYDEKTGIKPIFKYPSEIYWGQLEPGPY
jgi:hypothetical protein